MTDSFWWIAIQILDGQRHSAIFLKPLLLGHCVLFFSFHPVLICAFEGSLVSIELSGYLSTSICWIIKSRLSHRGLSSLLERVYRLKELTRVCWQAFNWHILRVLNWKIQRFGQCHCAWMVKQIFCFHFLSALSFMNAKGSWPEYTFTFVFYKTFFFRTLWLNNWFRGLAINEWSVFFNGCCDLQSFFNTSLVQFLSSTNRF